MRWPSCAALARALCPPRPCRLAHWLSVVELQPSLCSRTSRRQFMPARIDTVRAIEVLLYDATSGCWPMRSPATSSRVRSRTSTCRPCAPSWPIRPSTAIDGRRSCRASSGARRFKCGVSISDNGGLRVTGFGDGKSIQRCFLKPEASPRSATDFPDVFIARSTRYAPARTRSGDGRQGGGPLTRTASAGPTL